MLVSFQWFFANYTYQLALSNSQVGVVNVLSSTSSLFTLILASVFPSVISDSFTLSKFLTVVASMIGVVRLRSLFGCGLLCSYC